MRADRVAVVAGLAFILVAAGCTPARTTLSASTETVAPAARHHAPAPANPDLGTVMERFYQQVEGAHWSFAYAMLSPRYQAALAPDPFIARYASFADLDVSLQQYGDRVVVATIGAKERGTPPRARRFAEKTTLAWDGEDWKIDRIERRELSAARTR
jgi:hypothetical protein